MKGWSSSWGLAKTRVGRAVVVVVVVVDEVEGGVKGVGASALLWEGGLVGVWHVAMCPYVCVHTPRE